MAVEQLVSVAGFFKRKLMRNDFLRIKLILFDLLVNLRHQMDDRGLPHFQRNISGKERAERKHIIIASIYPVICTVPHFLTAFVEI